jgi:hypothetical protein
MLELLERQQRLSSAALRLVVGRPGRDLRRLGQPIWPMRCDSGALRLRHGDGPVVALTCRATISADQSAIGGKADPSQAP